MSTSLDPSQGIAVFTDGSAYHGDKSGGWAWVALDAFEGTQADSGHVSNTTIGRMELFAPTSALVTLFGDYGSCDVLIYSDSEYVVLGASDPTRARRKNQEWWADLDAAISLHKYVAFAHVKGHADNQYNNLADKLAGKARKNV